MIECAFIERISKERRKKEKKKNLSVGPPHLEQLGENASE
jgi:hypothetical protein